MEHLPRPLASWRSRARSLVHHRRTRLHDGRSSGDRSEVLVGGEFRGTRARASQILGSKSSSNGRKCFFKKDENQRRGRGYVEEARCVCDSGSESIHRGNRRSGQGAGHKELPHLEEREIVEYERESYQYHSGFTVSKVLLRTPSTKSLPRFYTRDPPLCVRLRVDQRVRAC